MGFFGRFDHQSYELLGGNLDSGRILSILKSRSVGFVEMDVMAVKIRDV